MYELPSNISTYLILTRRDIADPKPGPVPERVQEHRHGAGHPSARRGQGKDKLVYREAPVLQIEKCKKKQQIT